MIIKFDVDLKTVKKVFALMDMDVPSDEEIQAKLSGVEVNLSKYNDQDVKQAELGIILMAISIAYEK